MTYPEAVRYLESFINYEKIPSWSYKASLKLERFRGFLRALDNPQAGFKCIHVAGTKGKGSTSAFIAYILREAGFSVGLYTSPHLMDFRERIRILSGARPGAQEFEGMISKKDLAGLTTRLKPTVARYNKNSRYGPLTFFEICTALAFLYFQKNNTDLVVLETGLGGRLDATSAVSPLACAITPISYEHTDKLGNTLAAIAGEKAGIIKGHKAIVISAPQDKEAANVIRRKCSKEKARLYEVGKDIFYQKQNERFRIKGIFGNYTRIKIKLLGEHQLVNAAVAAGCVEALRFNGIQVSETAVRTGLSHTIWPGRCEVIARQPLVVLDGAQNVASAEAIKKAVRGNFKYKRLILILGISSDKDIKGICRVLYPLADKVILTRADNPRASQPQALARYFQGKDLYLTSSVKEARRTALNFVRPGTLILVCGSLFVVGEFKHASLSH